MDEYPLQNPAPDSFSADRAIGRNMDAQALLDKIFAGVYTRTPGGQVRVSELKVPGREVSLAHIIGRPNDQIYRNLCLDSGFHAGDDPTDFALGIFQITPKEATVIAADIAVKSGNIDIGFLDRFSGALLITGKLADVRNAIMENVRYFGETFGYHVCPITEQ